MELILAILTALSTLAGIIAMIRHPVGRFVALAIAAFVIVVILMAVFG